MTNDQYETLIGVDTKVTALLTAHLDHENRLRNLERFRNWAAGIGTAISAFIAYLFSPQISP
jgi:hypothetical protein